jgi:sigma-E factor negative regulatory protein RseB
VTVRSGTLLVVAGVVGLLVLAVPAATALQDPNGGAGDDDQRAVDLLRHSAAAMRATSYSGTRMVSAWGPGESVTVLVDVEHVAGQGTRLSVRGGAPQDAATFLAGGSGAEQASQMTVQSLQLLTEAYAVRLAERDSVAGRPSAVVEVSRAGAVVARLWVDEASGLLLRREILDTSGRLVRESTFIDVHVAPSDFMAHLPPAVPDAPSHGQGVRDVHSLESTGWDCPHQAGTMQLVGTEVLSGTHALHMTYSDGLSRMSVFEQHGSLDPDSVRGLESLRLAGHLVHIREGMPTYAVWEQDGLVLTAVTDGPLDTVASVVAGQPPQVDAGLGFWDRVASGVARLGDWANPLV